MDSTLACLAAWMPRQRWYAAKGRTPSLRLVAWWDMGAPEADQTVRVRTYLVADEGTLPAVLYQVPVVARSTASLSSSTDDVAEHIIGSPEPGTTFIDGPFDSAYTGALLRLLLSGGRSTGPQATATGIPELAIDPHEPHGATVLAGEQSNTSLIYRPTSGAMPIIAKIYRQVHPGLNPDIELGSALAADRSPHVPRMVGSIVGTWPDVATAQGSVSGSLAVAQEFLPDVEDAWRVALRAAAAGDDFADAALDLGAATADVHLSLARLFPTVASGAAERAATTAAWHRRLGIASAEVPEIAPLRDAIERVYDRAASVAWPALQRIHGDYHLGQVLRVGDRGWVLLDFEGEPLRPMAERTLPDLALRDVAGMLRSFDYVAGSIRQGDHPHGPGDAQSWAQDARQAFVQGYARATGTDLSAVEPLLEALELDKAVYEAIYETRNRPTWVSIPLRAIARLIDPGRDDA